MAADSLPSASVWLTYYNYHVQAYFIVINDQETCIITIELESPFLFRPLFLHYENIHFDAVRSSDGIRSHLKVFGREIIVAIL